MDASGVTAGSGGPAAGEGPGEAASGEVKAAGLPAGQFGDQRREAVRVVGPEGEVGRARLLPPAAQLVGGRRGSGR